MKKNLILAISFVSQFAFSQISTLDNSFASSGIFSQNENSKLWDNSKIIQNADGSLYFIRQKTNTTTNKEEDIVAKLLPNGILDSSFGTNGEINLGYNTADNGFGMRVQNNGKIIVAGGINNTKIIRILPNGQIDTTFGSNGTTTLSGNGTNSAFASQNIHLLNDKIIIYTSVPNKKIFRLNSDGTIDLTFGNNGSISTNGDQILLDSSNNIVSIVANSSNQYTIEKYSQDGQPLSTFGTNGILTITTTTNFDNIFFAYLDNSNNIIFSANKNMAALYKINSDGTFDNSFIYNFNAFPVLITSINQVGNFYYIGGTKKDSNGNPQSLFISAINQTGNTNSTFNYYVEPNQNLKFAETMIINQSNIIVSSSFSDGTNNKKSVVKYLKSSVLSTSEISDNSSFFIENPVLSNLNFKTNEKVDLIKIFSFDGKIVKTLLKEDSDLSDLQRGNYILKVQFKNGKKVTKKIVKK